MLAREDLVPEQVELSLVFQAPVSQVPMELERVQEGSHHNCQFYCHNHHSLSLVHFSFQQLSSLLNSWSDQVGIGVDDQDLFEVLFLFDLLQGRELEEVVCCVDLMLRQMQVNG